MSTPIPPPLRAAAGLAALTIDAARKVPQQLVGLPVLAVSTALQASLKAQQTYAGLIARGDEVLGQLRRRDDAPWARFDDDEPAGARPRSAFDATPEPTEAADGVADALAAEDLDRRADRGEAAEEAALVEEVDRDLDPDADADVVAAWPGGRPRPRPDADADVLALAEARAEQAEADAENVLGETEEDEVAAADAAFADAGLTVIDLDVDPAGADRPNGRPEGSGTEPGTDMPADGMALAADAAAAGAALAADIAVGGPGGAPVAGYDDLSIPQLRGRLRGLSAEQVEALVGYERATRARPPYLTMLENRLTTLRSRCDQPDQPRVPVAGPHGGDEDRRVGGPARRGLGRGAGHPAEPARQRDRVPHPARPGRGRVGVGDLPRRRARRGRADRGRAGGDPGPAGLLRRPGHADPAGDRGAPGRRRRAAGPAGAAQADPVRRGAVRAGAQAAAAVPADEGRPGHRAGVGGRAGRAGERPAALAGGRVPGRGGAGAGPDRGAGDRRRAAPARPRPRTST